MVYEVICNAISVVFKFLGEPIKLIDSLSNGGFSIINAIPNEMLAWLLGFVWVAVMLCLLIAAYAVPIYLIRKICEIKKGDYQGKHKVSIIIALIGLIFFYASFVQMDIKQEQASREYQAKYTAAEANCKQGWVDGYSTGYEEGWIYGNKNYTECQIHDAYLRGYSDGQYYYPDKLAGNSFAFADGCDVTKPSTVVPKYDPNELVSIYCECSWTTIPIDSYNQGHDNGYGVGFSDGEERCCTEGYYYTKWDLIESYTDGYIDGQSNCS